MYNWFKFCERCDHPIDWRLESERARTSVLGQPGARKYYCGKCVQCALSDDPEL